MANLVSLAATHRVIICVGSGGVGKTTTAASLALWGALHGRQTAVVTIDPAKRLADCLGLTRLSSGEDPLPAETFARYGLAPSGTLTALLVDQQGAWDAAVARYAPTEEIRERILANRFYQGLSRTFAGSHEYMALDALATLSEHGRYDLIVVDTPPTRQALDFLEAPQRLQRFLDSQMSKWFLKAAGKSGWGAFSAVQRTTTFLLRKIEDATGISALGEIAEFFAAMQSMFEDFGQRFQRVHQLLTSNDTAFVLVTSPEEAVLQEAEEFHEGLARLRFTLKGMVVNRVHQEWQSPSGLATDVNGLSEKLRRGLHVPGESESLFSWLVENFLSYQALARGEEGRVEAFRRRLPPHIPVVRVPTFPSFPADLSGLVLVHGYLFPMSSSLPRKGKKGNHSL